MIKVSEINSRIGKEKNDLGLYSKVTTWKVTGVNYMKIGEIIRESTEYIDKHIDEELTVSEIARVIGYSEYHFSRLFKKITGFSVMEYVKHKKLSRAAEEIRSGRKIIDIALKYGWESHNGFTKAFKKEFGYCPALLRAMALGIKEMGGRTMEERNFIHLNEHEGKEELYQILVQMVERIYQKESADELEKAYLYSCQIYKGMKRYSGGEYITHPLQVAILLAEMEADFYTVCAGLFCDALKKNLVTAEQIQEHLPTEIAELVESTVKKEFEIKEELFEQLVLIWLAERLHNMRTVKYIDEEQKEKRVKETMEVFIPLAERFGKNEIVDELKLLSREIEKNMKKR